MTCDKCGKSCGHPPDVEVFIHRNDRGEKLGTPIELCSECGDHLYLAYINRNSAYRWDPIK